MLPRLTSAVPAGSTARSAGAVRKAAALLLFLQLLTLPALAQRDGVLQIGDPVHRFLERQQTRGHLPGAFLTHQPLSAYEAGAYLDSLSAHAERLSPHDRYLLARYRHTAAYPHSAWLRDRVPYLYANGEDFLSARADDYAIQLNPLAYLSYGRRWGAGADPASTWYNVRGARLSGRIGRYVFFETRVEEIQQKPPRDRVDRATMPRERIVRPLPTGPDQQADDVLDYGRAMGVVGFRTRHFEVRFGRDRNRWGSGVNTLFLSDYAPVYDQLQIRTSFWRLQYVNLFAAMDDWRVPQTTPTPRKYGSLHHLSVHLPGRVDVGLFQSVVFIPDTTDNRRPGFDPAMLNPLIFYHQVEKDYHKSGNFAVGMDLSWVVTPGLRAYGQVYLTEFVVSEIFAGDGYWGNKWGLLSGLHVADVPVTGVDLRLEYARVRPYTYSHHGSSSLVHFGDVLGHPAGQNMEDLALFLHYPLSRRIDVAVNASFTRRGRDTATENYGGDPTRSYDTRVADYGVELLQGVRQRQVLVEARVGYELLPRLYLEGVVLAESIDDAERGLDRYVAPFLLLRWGLPFRSLRY